MLLSQIVVACCAAPALGAYVQDVLQLKNGGAKPLVETEELQKLITKEALEQRAKALYNASYASKRMKGHPTRVIGLPGHWQTIRYILDELRSFDNYYNVSIEPFHALDGHVDLFLLLLDGSEPKLVVPFSMTPPTPNKKPVFGQLVIGGVGCDASDFGSNARGNIVLVKRGECAFGEKLRQAGIAGAVGMVMYDPESGEKLTHGTLGDPDKLQVPSVLLLGDDGLKYASALGNGTQIEATLYIDSYVKKIRTLNVVAETVDGDHDNVVALGAHSDSVGEGPGINDDGSGTISLLEVAKQLQNFKVNNAVRFAWWAAEEEGLLGSNWYAGHLLPEENAKVRLFMDYDMMASPNYEYQVYDANNEDHPNGSGTLKDLYIDWYVAHGLNYTLIEFDGRLDYVGFIEAGIPAGGIATGAEGVKTKEGVAKFGGVAGEWFDQCYHQACDDLLNPNYEAWTFNTQLIAHSVATYANSFEGFPKRECKSDAALKSATSKFIYRGSQLII